MPEGLTPAILVIGTATIVICVRRAAIEIWDEDQGRPPSRSTLARLSMQRVS